MGKRKKNTLREVHKKLRFLGVCSCKSRQIYIYGYKYIFRSISRGSRYGRARRSGLRHNGFINLASPSLREEQESILTRQRRLNAGMKTHIFVVRYLALSLRQADWSITGSYPESSPGESLGY